MRTPPQDKAAGMAGRPAYTPVQIASTLETAYGIRGDVRPLPSDRDQNFRVTCDGTDRYVAKVANAAEDERVLDMQRRAMAHLGASGIACPQPLSGRDGRVIRRTDGHLMWVVTFLPGDLMAGRRRTETLLHHFGGFLGRLTVAMATFDHPAAHRELPWDVARSGEVITRHLPQVEAERRPLVERALHAYDTTVAPQLPSLPHSIIHNDANDHNVMLDGDEVTGIIDFGDMVHSVTLNELAVGATYAALGHDDPATAIDTVADGYARTTSLPRAERHLLPELVRTRLATSIAMSSHQHALEPDNDYLLVSQAPAWRALAALDVRLRD